MENYFEKNWDRMAEAYETFTSGENSFSMKIEVPAVLANLPNLEGKNALDLGCGSGRFAFLLEALGARSVIGVDISSEMINLANKFKEAKSSHVAFVRSGIEDLSFLGDKDVDFVFSSTVLHFTKDLRTVMKEIHRVLKADGEVFLSIIHPIFSAMYPLEKENGAFPDDTDWKLNYLDRGIRAYVQPWISLNPNIDDYLCKSYHHTLSDYFDACMLAGFSVYNLIEPQAPESWKTSEPRKYFAYSKVPNYLMLQLRKK